MSLSLAFIGLGAMGEPMAGHLADAGMLTATYDSRAEAMRSFCARHVGVRAGGSPADAANGVDAVITMLPTSQVVAQVANGPLGIAAAKRPPRFVIEMSSGVPGQTQAIARQLGEVSIAMLDAPVSGGVTRARAATLAIMVGGDAALLDAARPALERMGRVTHVGGLGAGQALKALNNMASAAGLLIASEVLWVATRFGIEPEVVVDVLNNSSGMNNATRTKLKEFVLSGSYSSGFGLDLMVKDLGIAGELAESLGAQVPLSAACLRIWRQAAQRLGPGHDHTEIAEVSAELAGLRIPD